MLYRGSFITNYHKPTVAEIIASELLKVVFEKLASEALKTFIRSQGIDTELKKLERTLTQIQPLLNDASQKEITDEAVKQWLNGLQHLAYDIDDLLDDLVTEAMHREFTQQSCAPGSKVIMTTRQVQLLKKLGYDNLNHLHTLSHDDEVSLFAQHAFGTNNFDSHPILRPYGEGIVKKCDGLPLALRVLGRLLRTKTEEDEWKELFNSEIWRLGKKYEIVPALRLSYHDLSACLKRLFAYCSLFLKDFVFYKVNLILLWMAKGFLHELSSKKSMECVGDEYFEELLSRSMFQHAPNNKDMFVMHDLLNDLATFVAEEFFIRLDDEMMKDVRKEALEKYRHMSS